MHPSRGPSEPDRAGAGTAGGEVFQCEMGTATTPPLGPGMIAATDRGLVRDRSRASAGNSVRRARGNSGDDGSEGPGCGPDGEPDSDCQPTDQACGGPPAPAACFRVTDRVAVTEPRLRSVQPVGQPQRLSNGPSCKHGRIEEVQWSGTVLYYWPGDHR